MGITDVCKNCPDRHPACWGGCPKYQQAKAEYEKRKQAQQKANETRVIINDVQYNGLKKHRKDKLRRAKSK